MSPTTRISRRRVLFAAGAACLLPALPSVALSEEAPGLREAIASGKLPPLPNRLPATPALVMFAAGRLAGWLAHALEQQAQGRLIRPRASYTGVTPPATSP